MKPPTTSRVIGALIGEDEVQRIWKEYFEELYNIDPREQVPIHMCDLIGFEEVTTSEESLLEELR